MEVLDDGKVWKGVLVRTFAKNGAPVYEVKCNSGGKNYGFEVVEYPIWIVILYSICAVLVFIFSLLHTCDVMLPLLQTYERLCVRKETTTAFLRKLPPPPKKSAQLLVYQKVKSHARPGVCAQVERDATVREGTVQYFDPICEELAVFFPDSIEVETVRYVDVKALKKYGCIPTVLGA